MLNRTTLLAVRSLVLMGLESPDRPLTPRQLATRIDCSESYLAKTLGSLVKAGILRSVKGSHGGCLLALPPEQITLLSIVEACQGLLIDVYCQEFLHTHPGICAFHRAMSEVHLLATGALSKWTLADLLAEPVSTGAPEGCASCRMEFVGSDIYQQMRRSQSAPRS